MTYSQTSPNKFGGFSRRSSNLMLSEVQNTKQPMGAKLKAFDSNSGGRCETTPQASPLIFTSETNKRASTNETPSTSNHKPLGDCYGKKISTFQWNKTQFESQDCNSEERSSLQTQHQLSHHLDTKVQETYT